MKISDFELYRDLLQRHSGLSLTAERSYLLDSRLTPVARRWGYPTLEAMTLALRGVPETRLVEDVIEAMMTNDTAFFRDMRPFVMLRDVILPEIVRKRGRKRNLRIWSAGCSSGQEPFSIAMVIRELQPTLLKGWRIEILGTDLSGQMIAKAKTGHFTQFEVQRGLPVKDLISHFDETDDGWNLHDDVRNLVHFEVFNILDTMDDLGLFDLIFCRNVLTYFDAKMRSTILSSMADHLADDGFMFLGDGERIDEANTPFRMIDERAGLLGFADQEYNLTPQTQMATS
ncbi:MAG: protein-glutamate O-methyltransferase CheR [Micavibrio aeruginosavorus]|nr:protein-glutamate O-methyltransferase CheR [Micavibrio aeruginosavorus]